MNWLLRVLFAGGFRPIWWWSRPLGQPPMYPCRLQRARWIAYDRRRLHRRRPFYRRWDGGYGRHA
ncbi:MAG: hypothetical protein H6974_11155 [Gammaproteobacteria bacterium]|nr:hypothetical protein [Gammaproteobacteria bacterium]